ncbi:MAG: glycosyltransferase [Candidatus Dormibacteraeota bacterium]|nr:glycosyltransferase [Candidatus Dormibacteraeota bacterium]
MAVRGHQVELYCAAGSRVPGVELVTVAVGPSAALALVMPGGEPAPPNDELRAGFEELFALLRRRGADAVTQHAFDADAFELSDGLPVLHTLHLPPIVPAVVAMARRSNQRLATVSLAAQRDWARAGVSATVLRNGVPDWEPEPAPVEPVALMAGRISPEKGIEDGVAAARLAGLRPIVVGSSYDPGYRGRLVDAEFLPAMRRDDLWRLMSRAAVLVMPVKWDEPFGLVAAEAQVAGCPVAAYDRGALGEVVAAGLGGFLAPPGDVPALAAAIRDCLALDRRLVREQARERLLIDQSLDAYEAALR